MRYGLERLREHTREILTTTVPPDPAAQEREWRMARLAAQELERRTARLAACLEAMPPDATAWAVVDAALLAGIIEGHLQDFPPRYHLALHADRGRRVRDAAAKGGKATALGLDPVAIGRELRALHEKNAHLSWTAACRQIAAWHNCSARTIQRHAGEVRW